MFRISNIPHPVDLEFNRSIAHPDLWLWDTWTCAEEQNLHLYCLAVAKQFNGRPTLPSDRNLYQFHIRHFLSEDDGQTWQDRGVFLECSNSARRNVWSGSILRQNTGALVGYTDTRWPDPSHPFVQSICIGQTRSFDKYHGLPPIVVSDPARDYDEIREAGYYLSGRNSLGYIGGEEDGPIMAWRDPFLYDDDGSVLIFWSAKVGPRTPAIASAKLSQSAEGRFSVELQSPILLPDAHEYTQAELPKIWRDADTGRYMLLVSACNRLRESQPDSEVSKETRLYTSETLLGDWRAWSSSGSLVRTAPNLFGLSPYKWHLQNASVEVFAPVTEKGADTEKLTIKTGMRLSTRDIEALAD